MLRVHFLNVGHGDCTIIAHPSGRLTMIDINNSQNYDDESFNELLAEERQKARASQGLAALNDSPLAQALGVLSRPPSLGVAGLTPSFAEDAALIEKARADSASEITDPIEFLKSHYPGKQIWRFILTHPDLDHMRGLARLHENVGFANFWDTSNTRSGLNFRGNEQRPLRSAAALGMIADGG